MPDRREAAENGGVHAPGSTTGNRLCPPQATCRRPSRIAASDNTPATGGTSMNDVTHWLQGLGLGELAQAFAAQDIGFDVLGSPRSTNPATGNHEPRHAPDFLCSIVVIAAAVPVAVTVAVPVFVVISMLMPLSAFTAPITMFLPIALLHPLLLDKVHRLAASVVAPAVPGPVLLV